ncbi:MAG: serpin family protein [Syntrophobacteraceae bacterium]|nr:serpin family protein [Syntrophobacteraceae bacterium]
MKPLCTMLVIISFAALCAARFASAGEPSSSVSTQPPPGLSTANNSFAAQIYGELSSRTGNLFLSPYSISSALAMAYAGARGDTARQIARALHFPVDQARLGKDFKKTNADLLSLARKDGLKLKVANGLFLTGGGVNKQFEAGLQDDYDAELFSGGVQQINAWVSRKTEGKIGKIIDRLAPNSVCVIVNAVYFKGFWKDQFSKSATLDAPFNLSSTQKVTAPLMHRRGDYKLLYEKDFQAVSIPYRGDDLSLVILLPRTIDGLSGLEKRLTGAKLGEWIDALDNQPTRNVELYVPKFTMEASYDLKPSLMRLGMKKAFTKGADFSAIGPPEGRLWIGRIKHKVFVKVDEEGTEAAAATAGEMRATAARSHPVFRCDHPFFFLIRDNRSSLILFMGRVADPISK